MIIGKETEQVEFKLTTGEKKEAMEAISAILNKHTKGTLYFGIDDNGFVKGQQISDNTKKDISRIITESIEPKFSYSIDALTLDGKEIIKVSFSGHNRPYSVNGKYLMRMGTENRKMSNEDLKRLIRNEDYSSKWEEELTNYTIDEVDDDTLFDFYQNAVSCGRLEMKLYDKERILSILDLVKDGYIKNGCCVLFGKNAKVGLKLATYATDNKVTFLDLKLITGNIYNLIDKAIEYILNHISWKLEIESRKRVERPEIPQKAIREIVVNAFAHATYDTIPEIEIGIHPSKLEIYNPGTFPYDLTPYDFIEKNMPSYKRNRLILDVLFRSKDVEKSGTGFQRVDEACKENNICWSFRKEGYGFFFEFIRNNGKEVKITENKISELEKKVYSLIEENMGISKKDMAENVNKSEKTIQRAINSLIDKGLVVRVGSNKEGYWKIVNK